MALTEEEIKKRIINNDTLFNYIHVIQQNFDILPQNKAHIGASIAYQDLIELRHEFVNSLYDTIVEWVYSSEKYQELLEYEIKRGNSLPVASSAVQRKARTKFRKSDNPDKVLSQGQFGELMLFHFIQRFMSAVPLLRKQKITTNPRIERHGADAIHYKVEGGKNIFLLGEAKTYISENTFNSAFSAAITSILKTYNEFRKEMGLYIHEDFLEKGLEDVAERFLNNTLKNSRIELVCIVIYNEKAALSITDEDDIHRQIENIIKEHFNKYDNKKIDIANNPILNRITYILFPVWKLDELVIEFSRMI